MKFTTVPVCPSCDCAMYPIEWKGEHLAECDVCQDSIAFAPWSYTELLTRIALEAMYSLTLETALRAGVKMPDRRTWLETPAATFLTPKFIVRAMQAGISLSVAPMVNPVSPPAGRVLQS